MRRARLRTKKAREHGAGDVDLLLHGFSFKHAPALARGRVAAMLRHCNQNEAHLLWQQLRDELLPAYVIEHPGTRPAAWWLWDAVERRQRIDGGTHPFDNHERQTRLVALFGPRGENPEPHADAYRLAFGRPTTCVIEDDFQAEYETQTDYLDRLGLLEDSERTFLLRGGEPAVEQDLRRLIYCSSDDDGGNVPSLV